MKKLLGVMLGVLTAIGGFVDIGDLVANALVGARFGMSLAWVVVVGVVGICVFAEMCGRVAAVSGRGAFDLVRERLGPRVGLANLLASFSSTFLTSPPRSAGSPSPSSWPPASTTCCGSPSPRSPSGWCCGA